MPPTSSSESVVTGSLAIPPTSALMPPPTKKYYSLLEHRRNHDVDAEDEVNTNFENCILRNPSPLRPALSWPLIKVLRQTDFAWHHLQVDNIAKCVKKEY